jgi:hypothetical protein
VRACMSAVRGSAVVDLDKDGLRRIGDRFSTARTRGTDPEESAESFERTTVLPWKLTLAGHQANLRRRQQSLGGATKKPRKDRLDSDPQPGADDSPGASVGEKLIAMRLGRIRDRFVVQSFYELPDLFMQRQRSGLNLLGGLRPLRDERQVIVHVRTR